LRRGNYLIRVRETGNRQKKKFIENIEIDSVN
jgi:hypothetical protein